MKKTIAAIAFFMITLALNVTVFAEIDVQWYIAYGHIECDGTGVTYGKDTVSSGAIVSHCLGDLTDSTRYIILEEGKPVTDTVYVGTDRRAARAYLNNSYGVVTAKVDNCKGECSDVIVELTAILRLE